MTLESFRSESKSENKYEFCSWEVWFCVYAVVLMLALFVSYVHYPGFSWVLEGKIRLTAAIKPYMDATLVEEDILWVWSTKLTFVNLVSVKTTSQSFVVDGQPKRVSRLPYMSRTTTHADHDQANRLLLIFVLFLGSKALFRCRFLNSLLFLVLQPPLLLRCIQSRSVTGSLQRDAPDTCLSLIPLQTRIVPP